MYMGVSWCNTHFAMTAIHQAGADQMSSNSAAKHTRCCRGVLLSRFVDQQAAAGDPYGHVAYVLTNVTRFKQGQVTIHIDFPT